MTVRVDSLVLQPGLYYCQPDVRNSHRFVILNYLANSCTVWLQFLDAYYRPFSDGIPTVFVDEGGFLASYLFRWLSRLPKNNNQTIGVEQSKENGTVAWEYCGFSKKGDYYKHSGFITNISDLLQTFRIY